MHMDPDTVGVTLFGNRVFADIIKLKRGHTGVGWVVIQWLDTERGNLDMKTHRHRGSFPAYMPFAMWLCSTCHWRGRVSLDLLWTIEYDHSGVPTLCLDPKGLCMHPTCSPSCLCHCYDIMARLDLWRIRAMRSRAESSQLFLLGPSCLSQQPVYPRYASEPSQDQQSPLAT